VARFIAGLHAEDVVLGGGDAKKLKTLPPCCRLGDNDNAFLGGFRMWERVDVNAELPAKAANCRQEIASPKGGMHERSASHHLPGPAR
jgi:hypothetical protein